MRILFVYGFEPSGHASAARALEAAAVDAGHQCVRVNVSRDINPILGPFVAWVYYGVITFAPGLWGLIYDREDPGKVSASWRRLYMFFFGGKARAALTAIAPDAVVCTHAPPFAALALEKRRSGFTWPLVAVVTDFRAHAHWFSPDEADLYLTAGPDERLPAGRVRETGIPVHPVFESLPERAKARARLGLPDDVPVVVVSGGSRGLGRLSAVTDAVLAALPRARVLTVCGGNRRLARDLKRKAGRYEGRLWVYERAAPDRMVEILAAADVLIGKGGGVTVAECLAARLPIVLLDPLPGQERRNADFLLAHEAAVEVFSPREAAEAARRLLEPEALGRAREKAAVWGKPAAARHAVEAVVSCAKISR